MDVWTVGGGERGRPKALSRGIRPIIHGYLHRSYYQGRSSSQFDDVRHALSALSILVLVSTRAVKGNAQVKCCTLFTETMPTLPGSSDSHCLSVDEMTHLRTCPIMFCNHLQLCNSYQSLGAGKWLETGRRDIPPPLTVSCNSTGSMVLLVVDSNRSLKVSPYPTQTKSLSLWLPNRANRKILVETNCRSAERHNRASRLSFTRSILRQRNCKP